LDIPSYIPSIGLGGWGKPKAFQDNRTPSRDSNPESPECDGVICTASYMREKVLEVRELVTGIGLGNHFRFLLR